MAARKPFMSAGMWLFWLVLIIGAGLLLRDSRVVGAIAIGCVVAAFVIYRICRSTMFALGGTVAVPVVGSEHHHRLLEQADRARFTLKRDPHHESDPHAIKVFYKSNHIGWVPRESAVRYASMMNTEQYSAMVVRGRIELGGRAVMQLPVLRTHSPQ